MTLPAHSATDYRLELLSGVKLPDGWTAETADGELVVTGPCPKCKGQSSSVPAEAPAAAPPETQSGVPPIREVYASCTCGIKHGDEFSCGRSWVVTVMGTSVLEDTAEAAPHDATALQTLQAYGAGELKQIQTRAEKWIAGLVAITGLVTGLIVIKGPEEFTKLAQADQWVVVGATIVGGVLTAFGLFSAYQAAFGDPMGDDELRKRADRHQLKGAWKALTTENRKLVKHAHNWLKGAALATLLGAAALAFAVIYTWVTPAPSGAGADSGVCVRTDSGIVELKSAPAVTDGELTVVTCPD